MKDFLSILTERISEFGNHFRKYIQIVSKNIDQLVRELEARKRRNLVHILHQAYDFASEFRIIAGMGETTEEKLKFLGTYYAVQFLHMNRQAIDLLRMEIIASADNRLPLYRDFMLTVGNNFRLLTATYIKELLEIFIKTPPEFVVMGVGTKSDQDDIDIGIIDDGSEAREKFNRTVALVSQEMQKFSTSFHFHLSEHIGGQFYSASIDEYKKVLDHGIRDFVIINEMLSGALIIGSEKMFEAYRREIIARYFYQVEGDNRFHEGYLRGILGEISSLLAHPISTTHLNFKEDALRAIKSIISAQKTIFNIEKVNAWAILDELKQKDKKRFNEYEALDRSLTFFEIFRYLYQLFVTQDEQVFLDDIALQNLRKIARLLGYIDMGRCHAEEHILVHYYEHIRNIRRIIPIFVNDIKTHLKENSLFTHMFQENYQGNLAEDYINRLGFFRGTTFWDDILDYFKTEKLLKKFINDLNSFDADKKIEITRKYIEWMAYDFYLLIKFLTILGENTISLTIYKDFNLQLLRMLELTPDIARNIAFVFYRYPHLIHGYFTLNDEENLKFYLRIIERRVYEEDIAIILNDLKKLMSIHLLSSKFFKHIFLRILKSYPECIGLLNKPERLKEFANGLYSDIGSMRNYEEKRTRLGDYYDLEMLKVGIDSLDNMPVSITNNEFIEFSDGYIQTLSDLCRREVDAEYKKRIITEDIMAIFAAGGHAREQAYDDDYDMIVLLNSEDKDILTYCNKVVSKMNAEIIKRGTIPHHRFAEYFGRFVIRLSELEQLLSEERPDIFIEKSQILGARIVVGTHRFVKDFTDRIVKTHIFDKKEEYVSQMINEIYSRHGGEPGDTENNIKEGVGGLRDIEMIMLIIKAQFNIKEPVNSKLFEDVASMKEELAGDLSVLAAAFDFLKHLRDIYRLTIGASDVILPEALEVPAQIMGFNSSIELYGQYKRVSKDVASTIAAIIDKLNVSVGK